MKRLTPLSEIAVPTPPADEVYRVSQFGLTHEFLGLKRLLGAADFSKSGDRGAGLAANSDTVREAARAALGSLTLGHLYDRPLLDELGRVDSVMRVNYDVDLQRFGELADLTVSQFKDRLLAGEPEELAPLGDGLTGVMAAAVAKLMDVHELILVARKLSRVSRARTTLGGSGTLSSRLQPNHPTDDLRGVALLVYAGLSLGAGDALIGINPATDTVDNVCALLRHLDQIRRQTGVPTQICVLAHVKTQMACLAMGAPVEIMFQSLAGVEATNLTEFGISVELLDEAHAAMQSREPLAPHARNFMYFETGQGSEYSYGKHQGVDMTTCEALCYGLARRYDPFMVNNVTGFIGPETHLNDFEMILANLQDHFMGKLLGLPMGMAPCYTLHSQICLEGQQMATQLLTSAGANYFMDVCLNTDRMLSYFDTSAHDVQGLRELHGREPAPEYLAWAIERGVLRRAADGRLARGPNYGQPRQFCPSDAQWQELLAATPAVYGLQTAGPRPADSVSRVVKANHAQAKQAMYAELDTAALEAVAAFRQVTTEAADKASHLASPGAGARLSAHSAAGLRAEGNDVQVMVTDGLSAEAVHANLPELWPVLSDGLASRPLRVGRPILVRYGRVKLAEHVAEILRARLVVMLVGERPGGDAASARSLSAYMVYQLLDPRERASAAKYGGSPKICFEYTVISNIYDRGLPPIEAASAIVEQAWRILDRGAAGGRLDAMLKAESERAASRSTATGETI